MKHVFVSFKDLKHASKSNRWKFFGILAIYFCLAVFIFVLGVFIYFSKDLPSPGEMNERFIAESTKIYDRSGQHILYEVHGEEKRTIIPFSDIPDSVKYATIALEDQDFYSHHGIKFSSIMRAALKDVIGGGASQGGSTITQQFVKKALLTDEKKLSRKIKEAILSIELETKYSKDEILEMYLNEAPYGGTAWGVGTAAEIYFNKPVQDLTLVESAFLAGLPQSPSIYSPYFGRTGEDGEPLWKMRSRAVLMAMKENAYITDLAYEDAINQLNELKFERTVSEIKAPHFVFYVRQQLVEMFGEELIAAGGLKITSTLDWSLQEKAQEIVSTEVDAVEKYNISNGAAMAMNPKTGEILAMIGSKDYFNTEIGGQFNVAVDGLRQPGSSIKPITYLALIQQGYNPASMIMDVETTFARNETEKPYTPKNYDGVFRGPVSVRQSLGSSLNIPAVKAMAIVGIKNWLTLAYEMGLSTLEPTEENMKNYGLAATLGGADVHMIELITAYSAFANNGLKTESVAILKVEDKDGRVLYEYKPVQGPQVIDPGEAFLINDILSDNSARLLAFGANSVLNTGKPIAVKTGTTNNMKDNWTIGWSQDIIVATWVGNNDGTEMSYVASGITGASPIWRKIIDHALQNGYSAPDWAMPDNVEKKELDVISGYPSHHNFPSKWDYVIKGTFLDIPDPIHRMVPVCRGENNKLATEAKIAIGDYDEKEYIFLETEDPFSEDGRNRWQEAVQAWIGGQSDERYKVPTEYCGEESDVSITLESPKKETNYEEKDVKFKGRAGSIDGIDKIEIYVDGEVVDTFKDQSEFDKTLELSKGKHEVYAKAYGRNGKTASTGKVKIGVEGVKWDEEEPTPTPTPTPTPIIIISTPTPTPTVITLSPTPILP